MSEWIKCLDAMPAENEEILFSYNNLVCIGRFANKKFYYLSSCAHVHGYCDCEPQEGVTHWMPLPEPPND